MAEKKPKIKDSGTDAPEETGAVQPSEGIPGLLGQVTGLIAPTLALIAGIAITGNVGRVQRNDPYWFAVALALLIAAGAFWILASIAKGDSGAQPQAGQGSEGLLKKLFKPRGLMAMAVLPVVSAGTARKAAKQREHQLYISTKKAKCRCKK